MQVRPICADMLQVYVQVDEENEDTKQEAIATIRDFQPLEIVRLDCYPLCNWTYSSCWVISHLEKSYGETEILLAETGALNKGVTENNESQHCTGR